MNKKISDFLIERGFSVEKNEARGQIDGFKVVVGYAPLDTQTPIRFFVSCYNTENKKEEFVKKMQEHKIKYAVYSYNELGVLFCTNGLTVGSCLKNLPALIDTVFATLKELEFKGIGTCPYCGETLSLEDTVALSKDFNYVEIHNSCKDKINEEILEAKAEDALVPNNYLRGFAGALCGALVGAVLMVVLYFIGFVAALSSALAFILGTELYKKFGGKENKMMILIVSLTSIAVLLIAFAGIYYVAANIACQDANLDYTGIEAFKYCLSIEEFEKAFTTDLLLQLLFIALGLGYNIYSALKSAKKIQTI